MFKSSMGAACATVLVALAGGLATPTASHAIVYGGVFDPVNANYRWSGNHVFDISEACLAGPSGWRAVNDGYGCTGGLIGGDVTVVNRQPPLGPEESRTLLFSNILASAINPINPNQPFVWGVYVDDGLVRGIDTLETSFFGFGIANQSTHGGNWSLEWTSGRATSTYCALFPLAPLCLPGRPEFEGASASLNARDPDPLAAVLLRNFNPGFNEFLPPRSDSVTFQRVPEPTTVTLVLAALGAIALTRRRQR